jgi:hypothetical protein
MPILYAKIPREDFALPTITHALFQEITDCPYHVTPLMATLKEQL